jgi:hypothetical protein
MGNKVIKEFHATKLGRGELNGTEAELISPEMVIQGVDSTTIVEEEIRQGRGKNSLLLSRQFINQDTKDVLFQVEYKQKSSGRKQAEKYIPRSIASDCDGSILYVDKKVTTQEKSKRIMLYKTTPVYPQQRACKDIKVDMNNLYLAAVVFCCDRQATHKTSCAYLCVVTGENPMDDTGFELQDLYKAIKIPKVRNGVLVIDMNGRAVGKALLSRAGGSSKSGLDSSSLHSRTNSTCSLSCTSSMASTTLDQRSTTYEIAPGAEAAAVIAVASSLF